MKYDVLHGDAIEKLQEIPDNTFDAHLLVPFSGSGSELIGAAKAGWPMATGIEMEPQWVEVAAKRLLHHSEGDE